MLHVENDTCDEVESGDRQDKEPGVLYILVEVIKRRFSVCISLFKIGSPLSVVVDVDLYFLGLIFCVNLEMPFIFFAVSWEWEAVEFFALSVHFCPPFS